MERSNSKDFISTMSDAFLFDFLVKAGKTTGPVVSTTRSMYEKLAAQVLKENPDFKLRNINECESNGHEKGKDTHISNGYSKSQGQGTDGDDEALETDSNSSRTSVKGSVKITSSSVEMTETENYRTAKLSQNSYRQTLQAGQIQDKEASAFEKRFGSCYPSLPGELLKNQARTESIPENLVSYRRKPAVDSESNLTTLNTKVTGPEPVRGSEEARQYIKALGIAILLATILAAWFCPFYFNSDQVNDENEELDNILASMN